jgi:hypothetical protein
MENHDNQKDLINGLSIPLQNITVTPIKELKQDIPTIKIVDCEDLQTFSLAISKFYKPISKTFIFH